MSGEPVVGRDGKAKGNGVCPRLIGRDEASGGLGQSDGQSDDATCASSKETCESASFAWASGAVQSCS